MLDHTLAHTKPRNWAHHGAARERRGRDRGVDRVRDRGRPRPRPPAPQGRQGVDAADRRSTSSRATRRTQGPAARWAPSTAPTPTARRGSSSASARPRELGYETQPEVVIVGGGQGGIALGARLRQLRRADDHRRAQRAPRRLLAQALQVALPARPGLVRPPALHQVPGELAGVLAEGQDRRLARDVHAGDGAQLLELDRGQERAATTRTPASGSSSSSATARRSRCARSSS